MKMELELGLSISTNNNPPKKFPILKELDLISYVNCKGKQTYYEDDDNCSTLSCQSSVNDCDYGEEEVINEEIIKKKRGVFNELESCVVSFPKTLPLLLWDKQPNEDDHQLPKRLCNSTSFIINKNEGDSIVGWPPIKAIRKRLNNDDQHYYQHRNNYQQQRRGFMFVKVQMEGFFITRKIDLKLYHSFQPLISNLLTMFGKGQDDIDNYELTYQDRDGDWLLAGDVPWRTFIESVQRLKLRRREDRS